MSKIIGILNYTSNSFSDGGRYNHITAAKDRIQEMLEEGVDIIDIGAMSTSYERKLLSEQEEWKKLSEILTKCANSNISVDTFYSENARKSMALGVGYINDVSGGKDPLMLEVIASNPNVKYIVMYSLILPANKNVRVKNIEEIYEWAEKKIDECIKYGIQRNQIIIDPGIGFSTNAKQSFALIKNIATYKNLNVQICVGHSRKSFFEMLTKHTPQERDIETLAASLYMLIQGVDYLRVHNVSLHQRAFKVFQSLFSSQYRSC